MTLEQMNERLDKLESRIDHLIGLLEDKADSANGTERDEVTAATPETAPFVTQAIDQSQLALTEVYNREELQQHLSEVLIRFGEPELLESFSRIITLLPQLEYALYGVAAGPELIEEALDLAHETLATQGESEHNLKQRLETAKDMLLVLTQKEHLQNFTQMGQQVGHMLPLVQAASQAASAHSELEGKEALAERLTEAFIRLSEADTLESLIRIATLAPQLEYAVYGVAAGPELLEEGLELLQEVTPLLQELTRVAEPHALLSLLQMLVQPEIISSLQTFVEIIPVVEPVLKSLPQQPRTLEILRQLNIIVEQESKTPKRIGMWGLLTALGDTEVQRAAGRGVRVATRLGEYLDNPKKSLNGHSNGHAK